MTTKTISVCFLIDSIANTGGTERVCTAIANQLVKIGYDVSILSMYGSQPSFALSEAVAVHQVHTARSGRFRVPLAIYKIRKKIQEIDPGVLICVDTALFSYAIAATVRLHLKHIVWEHFNLTVTLGLKIRSVSRILAARYSAAIVTLTKSDAEAWQAALNCKARILVIPNPNPFSDLRKADVDTNRVVLSVGRLTEQKGFDRLLDAWALVQAQDKGEWQLYIVGSGALESALRSQVSRLALDRSVQLFRETADIATYYQQAAIYCMASRFEGFPMVLLEAQGFGLPMVSYDCKTGPSEIINQDNGILVPDGDKNELASALLKLIAEPALRSSMAKAASNNSLNYKIEPIVLQWDKLFKTVADGSY